MIKVQNVLHIGEYDREKRQEILMMVEQLSRLSYGKKNMFLFLDSTFTGDLESKTFPPFNFIPTGHKLLKSSNVNIVTVSSGTLDLMGTLLAHSGTEGKRYAAPETIFSLNPGLKNPEAKFIPSDFLEEFMMRGHLENLFDEETNEGRRIISSTEHFNTDVAKRLGIIDSVILPEDLILDQDCTEDWYEVYGTTEWDK